MYEKEEIILSKEALEEALGSYEAIEDLECKQEIIERINEKIEICINEFKRKIGKTPNK